MEKVYRILRLSTDCSKRPFTRKTYCNFEKIYGQNFSCFPQFFEVQSWRKWPGFAPMGVNHSRNQDYNWTCCGQTKSCNRSIVLQWMVKKTTSWARGNLSFDYNEVICFLNVTQPIGTSSKNWKSFFGKYTWKSIDDKINVKNLNTIWVRLLSKQWKMCKTLKSSKRGFISRSIVVRK